MSTWLNRGASGGPCGELEEEGSEPESIRLTPTGLHESRGGSTGAISSHRPIIWNRRLSGTEGLTSRKAATPARETTAQKIFSPTGAA